MATGPLTDALRETLALFEENGPPMTTNEVADRLDLGRRSTYDRLDRLVERDDLETKKVGANARVWWRPAADPTASGVHGDLEDGGEQLALLVEAVEEYAIFMLDVDGRIETWNRGAERIKGYERSEVVGEHISTFYTEDDREALVPEENLADAAADGVTTDEGWRVRADGSRFWAHVTITALYDEDDRLTGFGKVTRDMTDRRERERAVRRERNLLDQILETSPIGIGVFDPDGSVDRMNARLAELLGLAGEEVEGYALGERELLDPDGGPSAFQESPAGRVLATGEPVSDVEVGVEEPDGRVRWLSVNSAPLADERGDLERVVATASDVTRRKEQARRLERQRDELLAEIEEMYERIDDAFYALDDEFRFTYVNERAEELLRHGEDDILGESVWEVFPGAKETPAWESFHRALDEQETTSFEVYFEPLGIWTEARVYPSDTGLSVYFRDVSERKARELELERYERVIETVDDGVYLVDSDGRFTMVNEAYAEMTGYEREELLGMPVGRLVDRETVERARAYERDLVEGERETARFEADVQTADGGSFRGEGVFSVIDTEGNYERVGVVRDITERKERERELSRFKRAVEASGHAIYMTDEDGRITFVNPAFEEITGYSAETALGQTPRILQSGEHDDDYYRTLWETVRAGEVWEEEITDRRRSGELYYAEQTIAPVTDEDGEIDRFVAVQNDITERRERARELERQRNRLGALNDLNDVVREITDAVIEQSTREEIERIVCEGLAAAGSYELAWIGDVRPQTQALRLRTGAGVDGSLDDATIPVDLDDPPNGDPFERALRTHEMQTIGDVFEDAAGERWREGAHEYGFRSMAAIPIVHEGVLYGVINVYADRPNAFTDDEGEVIEHLGEIVGHAIAAVERKRALTSDEVVELAFRVPGVFDAFDLPAAEGRLSLDRAVPLEDGVFLEYGSATEDMVDVLEAAVDTLPHWESVRLIGDPSDPGPTRFELRLVDPPVLSAVTALGGYVEEAVVEDGDYRMRIHLAPSADARRLIDLVQDTYPMARMVSKQQISRGSASAVPLEGLLAEHLTERQRTALEAAYFAGYFEWPRDVTGEEVADSLGVSAPTFHQHLRKAQQKLLRVTLDDAAAN